ncbi:Histidinol dehydrogenase [hydrothermal vent metagenome]|uniref:Histidinol dehydrogenase n=1 Tax=hydrothermal vent metagenome TaxID=652676 RepID=A0A3B0RUT8_9ZZZZ
MQILNWNSLNPAQQTRALQRPGTDTDAATTAMVRKILATVRKDGDAAVRNYTQRFDGQTVAQTRVPAAQLQQAWQQLPEIQKTYMRRACDNIKSFHQAQIPQPLAVEVEPGLVCQRLIRPIERVGIYVPGGSAPLFSSLFMAAIPAKLAGVGSCIVASPPGKDGKIAPVVLAAASLCELDEVYCMGGAQAIAAMGFGTTNIPRVDKVFGPGNQWVSEAKSQISQSPGGPAIDLPAGPSEVMVLADADANAKWVAADLLSQAEHDPLAQVILLADCWQTAEQIEQQTKRQLALLPRADIARAAMQNASFIVVDTAKQMLEIINTYAPEHLILQLQNPRDLLADIQNAGSIFIGAFTPEALGDYASGTNHVLPTSGAARAYSGLGVESFVKYISLQEASFAALQNLGPVVMELANMETLDAHARAVAVRLQEIP